MASRTSLRWMLLGVVVIGILAWQFATNRAFSNFLGLSGSSSSFNYDAVMAAERTEQQRLQATPAPVPAAITPTSIPAQQGTPGPIGIATADYSVFRQPTLSADFINRVLDAYTAADGSKSPARGMGQVLYDLSRQYNIDDAYAMATFLHESGFGTSGEATLTHSLGNSRCLPVPQEADGCVDQDRGGYASYNQWGKRSFEAWFKLLINGYVHGKLDAIWSNPHQKQVCQENLKRVGLCLYRLGDIIPTYAPAADHNDEAAYINSLCHSITTWQKGVVIAW